MHLHLLQTLIKRFGERNESYTIFIDVEKTYDIIPGDVMVLEKKEGSSKTYYDHTLM